MPSGAATRRASNVPELDGTIEFTVSGKKVPANAGENVWVARGTVHAVVATSDVCHARRPRAGDQKSHQPAKRRELPPDTLPPPDERTLRLIFNGYRTCEAGAGREQTNDDPRG
jgi:hypothetical protein